MKLSPTVPLFLSFLLPLFFTGFSPAPTALPPNGGFEVSEQSDARRPLHWKQDGRSPVYALDASRHRSGKQSLHIGFKDGANEEGYSGTMQRLDATPFAGKRLALEAYLQRTSEKSKVGVWLLLGDANGKKLFYANSYEQPFGDHATWTRHTLEVDVPADAVTLALGAAIYESDGEMWVDDVRLAVGHVVRK